MGTRSMIAIENPNSKRVKAIYCHWDGYLEHNGALLEKYYSNSAKVNNLIALGDLSSLRKNIGEKHAFGTIGMTDAEREAYELEHGDSCTFYGRDRGETGCEYKSFDDALTACEHYTWSEYYYLFKYDEDLEGGKWYYRTAPKGRWKRLATALKKIPDVMDI